jgi:thiol-disulfide isomerase/thioredoxin
MALFIAALLASQVHAAEPTEAELRRLEATLLHRRLDLSSVRMWDCKNQRWQPFRQGKERVLVLQLWAVECLPCIQEMPLLHNMVSGWQRETAVRFVFISETLEEDKLTQFWCKDKKGTVPDLNTYQSTDGRLRDTLETEKQPLTLLLDHDFVVREAFVGTLLSRAGEVAAAVTRMVAVTNPLPAR